MKVKDAMSPDVEIANPQYTLQEAAAIMERIDAGSLPVGENDRLVGMVTDRDIAIRGIGHGLGPDAKVREVMTSEVKYCYESDDLEEVSNNMADLQLRRMPVLNREKRLVGIISLGDLAQNEPASRAGETLRSVSEPGGAHSQSH